MKLHPRLMTGLFCIICISISLLIMKYFSLEDSFYFYSLGIIVTVAIFIYDYFD